MKEIRFVFLLLALTILASCSDRSARPSGILPEEKMQTVLWQMIQADEYVNSYFTRDSAKTITTEHLKRYQQIFDLNNITKEQFQKSYHYYVARPDLLKPIFDTMAARASREREESFKPKETPAPVVKPDSAHGKMIADSIRNKQITDSIRLKMRQDSVRLRMRQDSVRFKRLPDSVRRKMLQIKRVKPL